MTSTPCLRFFVTAMVLLLAILSLSSINVTHASLIIDGKTLKMSTPLCNLKTEDPHPCSGIINIQWSLQAQPTAGLHKGDESHPSLFNEHDEALSLSDPLPHSLSLSSDPTHREDNMTVDSFEFWVFNQWTGSIIAHEVLSTLEQRTTEMMVLMLSNDFLNDPHNSLYFSAVATLSNVPTTIAEYEFVQKLQVIMDPNTSLRNPISKTSGSRLSRLKTDEFTIKEPVRLPNTISAPQHTQGYVRTSRFRSHFFFRLVDIPADIALKLPPAANLTLTTQGPVRFVSGEQIECWVNKHSVNLLTADTTQHSYARLELSRTIMASIKKDRKLSFICGGGTGGLFLQMFSRAGTKMASLNPPAIEYRLLSTSPGQDFWSGLAAPIEFDPDGIQDDRPPRWFESLPIVAWFFIGVGMATLLILFLLALCVICIKVGSGCKKESCIALDQRLSRRCCCYPCPSKHHQFHDPATIDAREGLLAIHDEQYTVW